MITTYFFVKKGRCDVKKEPTVETTIVFEEVKRRRRKAPVTEQVKTQISFKSLFELYVRECQKKGLAEETISGYKNAIRYFLDFTGYELLCCDVTQDLINEYYLYLQEHYKPQTVNSYAFKVAPTVFYGIKKGYIKEGIEFTHCKEQLEIKDIYSQQELEILLKRPKENDFCEIRAWTIINLFLATGIRAKELRYLKVGDVNLQNSYIVLNATKNKEARILPMPTTLYNIITEWIQLRDATKDDWLFCNIYGEQLQRSVLQNLVKRYSLKRGVKKYGLHLYRHTFITLSVRNGMDSIMLKRITGHKSMKMLERYYACNPTDLVNVIDEYNPLENYKDVVINTNGRGKRQGYKERKYR